MQQETYQIKETAQKIDVESHVLRYWEEELELSIHRNDQGHRFYTEEDVTTFQFIKDLKKQGYQLKAIKKILDEKKKSYYEEDKKEINILESGINAEGHQEFSVIARTARDEKNQKLQKLLKQVITEAVKEHDEQLCMEVKDTVIKELDYQFRIQEEEHFKHLDTLLRERLEDKKRKRLWK